MMSWLPDFTPTSIILGLLLIILAVLYVYVTYPYGYFDIINVPYPKPIPPLGNIPTIKKLGGLHVALLEWMKEYGNVYGIFQFRQPILVCGDPDKLKQILVKNFSKFKNRQIGKNNMTLVNKGLLQLKNDDWKRVRSTLSPTFTSGKMKQMYPLIKQSAERLKEIVHDFSETGENVNVNRMYENFTMDVIASTAFGIKLDAQHNPNEPFVINCRKLFAFTVEHPFFMAFPYLSKFFLLHKGKWKSILTFWKDATEKVYESRQPGRKNMLSLMMEASKAEQEKDENKGKESGMTKEEIKDNIMTFLLAGYETTSNALAFTTYLLALNVDKQDLLYDDIIHCLQGKIPDYDNINSIPYLDYVLKESLRLYPPGFRFARCCTETCYIDEIKINVGDVIMAPVFAMHRNPEFFHDPNDFIPERFHPDSESSIKPFTYLPFGEGPRTCIGMRFAMLEAKLALTLILLHYKFIATDKTEVPLPLSGGITLTATNGIHVKFEKRTSLE